MSTNTLVLIGFRVTADVLNRAIKSHEETIKAMPGDVRYELAQHYRRIFTAGLEALENNHEQPNTKSRKRS